MLGIATAVDFTETLRTQSLSPTQLADLDRRHVPIFGIVVQHVGGVVEDRRSGEAHPGHVEPEAKVESENRTTDDRGETVVLGR